MDTIPVMQCKWFEDNLGAFGLANVSKMRVRPQHVNTKNCHFCADVAKGLIKVLEISTQEQLADIVTKNFQLSSGG